jgi:hypothetical protein
MTDESLHQKDELTTPLSTDIMWVQHDPSGSVADNKVQLANLHKGLTKATSAQTITGTDTALPVSSAGAAAAYKPIVAIYNTATAQSFTTGSQDIVNFTTVVNDTDSAVTVGAAWKFTAPASKYYHIDAQILFSVSTGWADIEYGSLVLFVDGVAAATLDRKDSYAAAGAVQMQLGGSTIVYLAATSYLDVRAYQNSGGTLTLETNAGFNRIAITSL